MTLSSPKRMITLIGVPAACLLFVATAMLPPYSPPARAQASGMFGAGDTDTVSVRATVKAVDMKTRTVTGPQGETKTLKVGDQVKNLAQVKPGDTVVARFYDAVAYVVALAGTKLPEKAIAMAEAQAAPGELPAGGVGAKIINRSSVDRGGTLWVRRTVVWKRRQSSQFRDRDKVSLTLLSSVSVVCCQC
jgi:hypothetical protein